MMSYLLEFQFLIGTIKTSVVFPVWELVNGKFQFLIGTIKTQAEKIANKKEDSFNSL